MGEMWDLTGFTQTSAVPAAIRNFSTRFENGVNRKPVGKSGLQIAMFYRLLF
jgi:hypothetical protein